MNERICNQCNLPLGRGQVRFCSRACANRFNMKAKAQANRAAGRKECDVTGCGKPARTHTAELCPMHYHRMYRNGSLQRLELQPKWVDITGERFGTLTVSERRDQRWLCVCDCGAERLASAGELNRTGDANTCGTPGRHLSEDIGYNAAHGRVHRLHGPARDHLCVDCSQPAAHWSYNHDDPDERYASGLSDGPIPYSIDPQHYSPRCVSCHKTFDIGRAHHTTQAA